MIFNFIIYELLSFFLFIFFDDVIIKVLLVKSVLINKFLKNEFFLKYGVIDVFRNRCFIFIKNIVNIMFGIDVDDIIMFVVINWDDLL